VLRGARRSVTSAYTQGMKLRWPEIVGGVGVGVLFVAAAWAAATYSSQLDTFLGACGGWGMLAYTLVAMGATIIAPVSATPLIPVASELWGPLAAALLSVAGWTVGATVAFWLARCYGYRMVKRFVRLRRVQKYADALGHQHLFWTVILLRLVMPVDVLSYALGLFSQMPLGMYVLATIIGITPFAFVFAYTATLPLWVQGLVLAAVGILLYFSYRHLRTYLLEQSAS